MPLSRHLLALGSLSQTPSRNLCVGVLEALAPLHAELASVVAVCLQVSAVARILECNSVLADVRQAENRKGGGQDAERGRYPEGVLGRGDGVVAAGCLDVREN